MRLAAALEVAFLATASLAAAQQSSAPMADAVRPRVPGPTSVRVSMDAGPPRTFTAADLARLARDSCTATAHGVTAHYTGVRLATVLRVAGAWPGTRDPARDAMAGAAGGLRGAALARYVVVTGADGYRAVFALAELDSATSGSAPALLVDRADGAPLAATDGPLRIVAPSDRRPARWVHGVASIDVRTAAP